MYRFLEFLKEEANLFISEFWFASQPYPRYWYFKPGDLITWNTRVGVETVAYEREFGKVVKVEETSIETQPGTPFIDGSSGPLPHQYVKIKGKWFSAEWFVPTSGPKIPPKTRPQ
jgi:hypothetical protein